MLSFHINPVKKQIHQTLNCFSLFIDPARSLGSYRDRLGRTDEPGKDIIFSSHHQNTLLHEFPGLFALIRPWYVTHLSIENRIYFFS